MKSRALFAALAFVLMVSTVQASGYSENFSVYRGSEVNLEGYEFEYSEVTGEQVFTALSDDGDDTSTVEHQLRGDEIFESVGVKTVVDSGLNYSIVGVDSDEDGLFLELEVNASRPIFDSAEISTDAPSNVFVAQDDELEISLELENTGVVDQTFELDAETHESIDTFFLFDEFEVSELEVPRGETETLTLQLDVPTDAPTGPKQVNITAEGNTVASESLNFEVRGEEVVDPSLEMRISESFVRMTPGQTQNIPVNLRAQARPVENIDLDVNSEVLDVQVPNRTVTLDEYGNEEVVLQVEASQSAEQGDYFVEVTSTADDVEAQTEEVRINVYQESILRYVGLLIMILSLGLLAGVYRKFGRR